MRDHTTFQCASALKNRGQCHIIKKNRAFTQKKKLRKENIEAFPPKSNRVPNLITPVMQERLAFINLLKGIFNWEGRFDITPKSIPVN